LNNSAPNRVIAFGKKTAVLKKNGKNLPYDFNKPI